MLHNGSSYSIAQENFYYPFGGRISTLSSDPISLGSNKNRYMYNGKEFNDHMGLNWYDYGARFYDAQIARWHSVDPLAEKYYSISPFVYAANNPILFIDPDGRYIEYFDNEANRWRRLSPSSTRQPTDNFGKALYQVYMHFAQSDGGGENFLEAIFSSDFIVRITETSDVSLYQPAAEFVYWNPLQGLETDRGILLSPSTILEHEMAHGVRHKTDFDGYIKDRGASAKHLGFPNMDELGVVKGPEQRTAQALGEVGRGEPTRDTYYGVRFIITYGPTSTHENKQRTYQFNKRRGNRSFNVDF
jgi:RHS repeat-associated protein